jgi:hypothetical protein
MCTESYPGQLPHPWLGLASLPSLSPSFSRLCCPLPDAVPRPRWGETPVLQEGSLKCGQMSHFLPLSCPTAELCVPRSAFVPFAHAVPYLARSPNLLPHL